MIAHAESLVSEVAQSKCLECAAKIAADHCHRAQILIDHGDESAVAGELRLAARRRIDRGSLIKLTPHLIDDADDVERLGDRRRRSDDVG